MTEINDKTSSVFVTRQAFDDAARECKLETDVAEQLWSKLANTSTQRIIGGATAPRQDAANVNNWHWSELDLAGWAKKRLTALLVGVAAQGVPDKGWVKVTKLESCTGEASVSNRKGKRIVAYELNVKCIWEGQVDYDDVSGELLMPYISEDVSDSAYETKLTAKEPTDASHKKALKLLEKQLPLIKERLQTFTDEIYDDSPKEL
uniref:Activator of Hsp90 ATPase AHSA1-like N-terminal domain-containing protein n=1 Tax=Haptolina ericina TaxID=156174 RepID=A0A7S3FB77_9EUKA